MLFGLSPKPVWRGRAGQCTVELYHVRYLRNLRADALILLSNRLLWMGARVSKRVRDEAGDMVEDEARRHAPLPSGEAIHTGGGMLRVKYIVHANPLNEQLIATPDLLAKALDSALRQCEQLGARRVLFPDFTEQLVGWNPEECAHAILQAIGRNEGKVHSVLIACWDKGNLEVYRQAFSSNATPG